jgi:ABC-type glycerol-3-phosphate transport system permease component
MEVFLFLFLVLASIPFIVIVIGLVHVASNNKLNRKKGYGILLIGLILLAVGVLIWFSYFSHGDG